MASRVESEQWMTVRDVADHLRVSQSWVNKQVTYGEIPVHRIGRNLRFLLSEVDTWILGEGDK